MTNETLPCLLLPIQGKNLILPSAAIAEIIPFESVKPISDTPKWLLGILSWRGIHIPLTYLEKMESHLAWNGPSSEKHEENSQKFHIAIINRVQKISSDTDGQLNKYPFFSIVLTEAPKLHRIVSNNVKMITKTAEDDIHFLMEVKIHNDYAFIPNLISLWNMIDELPSRLQWFRQIIL